MDGRDPAAPAPFEPEQVDALVRGVADENEVAELLERHSPSRPAERAQRSRKRSPVRLAMRDLVEAAAGSTPEALAGRLEEAEKKDPARLKQVGPEKEAPTTRPPPASRRRSS